ncbi:MAG: glycosyltransferase family 4 protein [candidate division NC10 bacterium]|nr:glycosyltransferase family 4 protein [candidate division NC10 bacterium]MDE2321237.1 glycosyltransferase family 4 protein [candidate division NC10 bacterium]
MKVAQICHVYLPHIGGTELHVYNLVRDLARAGHTVEVLTTDMETALSADEINRFPAKRFNAFPVLFRNPFPVGLARYLTRHRYDLIHVHSPWLWPSIIGSLLKRTARLVVTSHGLYPTVSSRSTQIALRLSKPLAAVVFRRADAVIALSASERERLISFFQVRPEKVHVVAPTGVEPREREPGVERGIRSRYQLDGSRVVLFTGRIIPEKHPDVLLDALPLLRQRIPAVKLLFVGPVDPRYQHVLLGRIDPTLRSEVVFAGAFDPVVDRAILHGFYAIADAFVALGAWEGLPTRLLEAMAHRVPCVAFRAGGVTDLIQDRLEGLLLEKLDPGDLAAKLFEVLVDQDLKASLTGNAFEKVMGEYRRPALFQRILDIYCSVSHIPLQSVRGEPASTGLSAGFNIPAVRPELVEGERRAQDRFVEPMNGTH